MGIEGGGGVERWGSLGVGMGRVEVETVERVSNKTSTNIPIYIRLILSFEWLGKSDLTHNHNLARR